MTDAIRTPDVLLDGLPGFDWAPSFRTWDGLRLAHVDVGDGAPVRDAPRRADLELPVAQGRPAGAATPATA